MVVWTVEMKVVPTVDLTEPMLVDQKAASKAGTLDDLTAASWDEPMVAPSELPSVVPMAASMADLLG